jgi:CheY-like chemotaxis protein
VLAAEDNEVNQLVLRSLLQAADLELMIVPNGEAAVRAAQQEAWDLILMDIQMPILDGISATKAIRARERMLGRPPVPIIALSANAMAHQTAEYLACGMQANVAKPIQAANLFATIQQVLDAQEDRQAEQPRLTA